MLLSKWSLVSDSLVVNTETIVSKVWYLLPIFLLSQVEVRQEVVLIKIHHFFKYLFFGFDTPLGTLLSVICSSHPSLLRLTSLHRVTTFLGARFVFDVCEVLLVTCR
jgi:hypothetical protein